VLPTAGRTFLKLVRSIPEATCEIQALRCYDGRGAVRLIDYNETDRHLLLERLVPGTPLAECEDDEAATRIAAGVMRTLWRPLSEGHGFPTAASWAEGLQKLRAQFGGATGPFPAKLVSMAECLFQELIASSEAPVILHGDLHHFNILSAEREPWLAIDPKGVVGEPAYDVGALLRNPHPDRFTDPKVQRRRIDILCEELRLDRRRVIGWGIAQAVLAAWWSFEDSGEIWTAALECAAVLAEL